MPRRGRTAPTIRRPGSTAPTTRPPARTTRTGRRARGSRARTPALPNGIPSRRRTSGARRTSTGGTSTERVGHPGASTPVATPRAAPGTAARQAVTSTAAATPRAGPAADRAPADRLAAGAARARWVDPRAWAIVASAAGGAAVTASVVAAEWAETAD